jgi:hypothetical protein
MYTYCTILPLFHISSVSLYPQHPSRFYWPKHLEQTLSTRCCAAFESKPFLDCERAWLSKGCPVWCLGQAWYAQQHTVMTHWFLIVLCQIHNYEGHYLSQEVKVIPSAIPYSTSLSPLPSTKDFRNPSVFWSRIFGLSNSAWSSC